MCVISPLLMRTRTNLSWKEMMLFSWVGIRGTICLILALEVSMDNKFDATYRLQSKVCNLRFIKEGALAPIE